MVLVSVMYPVGSGNRFDMDYYLSHHMPMVRERWSPMGLHEAKVIKGVATPDGSAVPFPVIALLTWDSAESFKAGAETHGAEIFGDIPKFTDVQAAVQINEHAE